MKVIFIAPYAEWTADVPRAKDCACDDVRSHWLGWILPIGQKGEVRDECPCGRTVFEIPKKGGVE